MNKLVSGIIGKRAECLPDDIRDIRKLSVSDLTARGLKTTEARRLFFAIQLAEEVASPKAPYSESLSSPASAIHWCQSQFRDLIHHGKQEEFWIVSLDTKNVPIRIHQITVGTLRNSLVHPREVFRAAILDSANGIIAVHNHPSGNSEPSEQDYGVTDRIVSAGEIIGITVLDHIVVARDGGKSIMACRGKV